MTLGQKLKEIRKRFGLSQEQLAEIMNVSRQAITKWEADDGIPDITNIQKLSKVFGLTVDYLLDSNNELPTLFMKKKLDKDKYKNKIYSYEEVLRSYYPEPWEVYVLIRQKKMNKLESIFDFFVGAGTVELADALSDISPYYLAIKDNIKLIINIKDWALEIYELSSNTNVKKIVYGKNKFKIGNKLDLK